MDEATQQNAALVEEAAAASQSLQEQAGNLAAVVSTFRLAHGQASAPARTAPPQAPRAPAARPPAARKPAPLKLVATRKPAPARSTAAADDGDWEVF